MVCVSSSGLDECPTSVYKKKSMNTFDPNSLASYVLQLPLSVWTSSTNTAPWVSYTSTYSIPSYESFCSFVHKHLGGKVLRLYNFHENTTHVVNKYEALKFAYSRFPGIPSRISPVKYEDAEWCLEFDTSVDPKELPEVLIFTDEEIKRTLDS
jgi:hypothetical protein